MTAENFSAKKFKILNYGCQMNVSDSERMAGFLKKIGCEATQDAARADILIINTCCVRESAEERIWGKIGETLQLKRKNPALIIGVTGCMAQKESDRITKRAPHVDFVLGTNKAAELADAVQKIERKRTHIVNTELSGAANFSFAEAERTGKFSAWIPIMQGCDNFCTYCIVPYVRGREYSRPAEEITDEIKKAAERGFKEITLLGQNVNSYGQKNNGGESEKDFADLLTLADGIDGIERIRFMTSHPKDLSDKVITTMKNGRRICPHIHLPVQHACDRILKAMNRGYTGDEYRALAKKIRAAIPDIAITTDIIVGFPGETDEDFAELLAFVKELRFDSAYTFLYSPRSGTPAAKMAAQIDESTKKRRLDALMAAQNKISLEINEALNGKIVEVLTEGPSKTDPSVWTGRTATGKPVLFAHGEEREGDFVRIKITHPQTWLLKGERVF